MEILTVVCGAGMVHEYVSDGKFVTLDPRESSGRRVGPEFPEACKNCRRCEGVEDIRPCDYLLGRDLSPQDGLEKNALKAIPEVLREKLSKLINLDKIMDTSMTKGPINRYDVLDIIKSGIVNNGRGDRDLNRLDENIDNVMIVIGSVFPEEHTGLSKTMPQNVVVDEARNRAMHLAKLFLLDIQ